MIDKKLILISGNILFYKKNFNYRIAQSLSNVVMSYIYKT